MPDFAPNYSNRYRLRYSTLGIIHTLTFRYGIVPSAVVTTIAADMQDVLNALAPIRFTDWTEIDAAYAEAGSDVFLPTATLPGADAGGATVPGPGFKPVYAGYIGLTALGNRANFSVFGMSLDPLVSGTDELSDYRVYGTEASYVADTLTALAGAAALTGIDGAGVLWHQYQNIGIHAHYQRKVRT